MVTFEPVSSDGFFATNGCPGAGARRFTPAGGAGSAGSGFVGHAPGRPSDGVGSGSGLPSGPRVGATAVGVGTASGLFLLPPPNSPTIPSMMSVSRFPSPPPPGSGVGLPLGPGDGFPAGALGLADGGHGAACAGVAARAVTSPIADTLSRTRVMASRPVSRCDRDGPCPAGGSTGSG
jgi:hypothetical protein